MPSIGEYVVVRSRDQGCVCGEYRGHVGREVTVSNARQIYRWNGQRLTLFDVAAIPGECRLSATIETEVTLLEACGIIICTPEVERYLRSAAAG